VTTDLLSDFEWLVSPAAQPHLQKAAAWRQPSASQVEALRRACSSPRARLVVEQAALRRRGQAKFEHADQMFFTPRGFEQASDEIVAAYKAARMPTHGPLVDLCCGIGGDLMAMAAQAPTRGVDRDPGTIILARANLAALQSRSPAPTVSASRVEIGEARESDLVGAAAWHADPDRRPFGRRTTRVELHDPSAEALQSLLDLNGNAVIKLAPAAVLPECWSERAELEWISRAGECRQLAAWFGTLATAPGERRATLLSTTVMPFATIRGVPLDDPPTAARIGRYLYEPDAAVLAAELGGALATRLAVEPLAPSVAYWTSDSLILEPAVSAFEVLEVLGTRVKHLKPALRSRHVGVLEIKKRGIELEPESLRRELELRGDESASLLLTRVDGRAVAILARRLR
jgi:hypothetical protein